MTGNLREGAMLWLGFSKGAQADITSNRGIGLVTLRVVQVPRTLPLASRRDHT
jgi:hypothetical protein